MSKDGRDSATLILMKISHFDRTALYLNQIKITQQKLDLQSSTIYQINRNSIGISVDASDLR